MSEFAWAVLSFFLGYYLGHRLQLGRDRRVELNEAMAPFRAYVVEQQTEPSLYTRIPDAVATDRFVSRLGPLDARRFWRALEDLHEAARATEWQDEAGQMHFTPSADWRKALATLADLTRPR